MDNRNNRNQRVVKKELHRINERVTSPMVRLVGEGVTQGIYTISEALKIASNAGLDLVEISPNANPPVCRVIDYGKFLYEQKRNQPKPQKNVIKEIKLTPHTDDHDINFKKNHAIKFLESGAKVKVTVFFKGRAIAYKDQGEILLLRFAQELEEYGKPEHMPLLEGKNMRITLAPKKNK